MRVLSAIQPTGNIHLGNYLGAIKQFLDLQQQNQLILAVANLHSLTANLTNKDLESKSLDSLAMLIATGIDPSKNILFIQSQNPDHLRLSWVLTCIARLGWLGRMTQFKEKSGANQEQVSLGLFSYPVLMVADILAYKASHVPVGQDQLQHLELARDIVAKYNSTFCKSDHKSKDKSDLLIAPQAMVLTTKINRVMSLRDGLKKMSKSDVSEMTRINLTDSDDDIVKKISKAKSDSLKLPKDKRQLIGRPEAENLLSIYSALKAVSLDQACEKFYDRNFSDLKSKLTELLIQEVSPIRTEYLKLRSDRSYLAKVAKSGLDQARAISKPIVDDIYRKVGFLT